MVWNGYISTVEMSNSSVTNGANIQAGALKIFSITAAPAKFQEIYILIAALAIACVGIGAYQVVKRQRAKRDAKRARTKASVKVKKAAATASMKVKKAEVKATAKVKKSAGTAAAKVKKAEVKATAKVKKTARTRRTTRRRRRTRR
jgi:cytochrome c biogenesis factor